jgi:hypothetical protein
MLSMFVNIDKVSSLAEKVVDRNDYVIYKIDFGTIFNVLFIIVFLTEQVIRHFTLI